MRIAYIAPYQGPDLVERRPSLHNLSLAARVKIQLIAESLRRSSHDVEIISQGDVDKHEPRYYPAFAESQQFHPGIPIFYASALPIRFLVGFWENLSAQRLLKARHKVRPFDVVIVYNMRGAQIGCANYAQRLLGLPVILEYEDDSFVNVQGYAASGLTVKYYRHSCRQVLRNVSGGMSVSPYLMSQFPSRTPNILLRGVVSGEILKLTSQNTVLKKNWVVFSGTHEGTQGLEQMVEAWQKLRPQNWELHIAGHGPITPTLERKAAGNPSIIFHGLLNRDENARLLCMARIGMNAQDLTRVPGNVFAFKIIEYLAAGVHVITTPRGKLETELEAGISYISDNTPDVIAEGLQTVIAGRLYENTAVQAAIDAYGPTAVSNSLNRLVTQVTSRNPIEPLSPSAAIPSSAGNHDEPAVGPVAE